MISLCFTPEGFAANLFSETRRREVRKEKEKAPCAMCSSPYVSPHQVTTTWGDQYFLFFHQIIFFYPYLNYFTKAPKHFIFLNNRQNFGTGNYIFTGDLIIYGGKKIDELKESLRMDIYLLESPACPFKMETNFIRVFLYIFFKNGRHYSVAPMLPFHVDVGSTITHPQSGFITKRCYV